MMEQQKSAYAIAIILFSTSQLLSLSPTGTTLVNCQDFEDLNKQQQQQPPSPSSSSPFGTNTFSAASASFGRQPAPISAPTQSVVASNSNRQRPLLSNRFSPGSANGQQQLLAQPTSSNAAFASAQPAPSGVPSSNIEQMMKNALARTTQLNAAAAVAAEPRSDSAPAALAPPEQSRPAKQAVAASQPAPKPIESSSGDRQPEASEFAGSTSSAAAAAANSERDDAERQTTLPAGQADSTSGHETVYGDQRFASLFARRNNARKAARFQPSEQVKAKPTLPSFIKSPPDPKQFSAAAAQAFNDGVPGTRGTSAGQSAASSKQQQQNRANLLASQQKKAVLTSNSAVSANNKRLNAAATARPTAASPKVAAAASNARPLLASKPATAAAANPFGRAQAGSGGPVAGAQDPASVIAMARKRLLANNALESAKLKQQQQQQAAAAAAAAAAN